MILMFFPLILWGGICLLSPETAFELTKGWMFEEVEPSKMSVVYIRMIGILQIVAALYVVFAE
ncbi:MAG: hypothetical protein IKC03_10010 [Oscillospiraceae bacterium]|nr:hypothetical protein [Oscillospiraceae bacterium]